jgi:translocation and assembly module TamA
MTVARCASNAPAFVLALLLALPGVAGAQSARVEVHIEGLTGAQADGVRTVLSIAELAEADTAEPVAVRRAHRRAAEEIRAAMGIYGYYHSTVQSSLEGTAQGGWLATYRVEPGAPVRIQTLDLRIDGAAADDARFQRWRREFPLATGDALAHQRYEDGKRELLRLAQERGYLDAELVRHEVIVDVSRGSAAVHLALDSGPRYGFGPVTFEQDTFDPVFLRRFVRIAPGDPYRVDALFELERALRDTGLFAEVAVRPGDPDPAAKRLPIAVRLTERKRSRYDFGLGFGTDTGPRAKASYERRWVNARGHSFGAEAAASSVRSHAGLRYRIPLRDPARQKLLLGAAWVDETTDTSSRRTASLTATVSRRTARWWHEYGVSYEREDFIVGGDDGSSALLFPRVGWQRSSTEDRIHVERGWQLGMELKGAVQGVLSDFSFAQASGHVKFIQPLGERGRVVLRGAAGTTWVEEFAKLPPSLRFFTGGDNSVRGYEYNALGSKDEQGNVIGGRHLAVGSVEYEHRLNERFSLAAFYDAGSAFDGDGVDLNEGAGIGLRWRLPFGTVRLDLANALSRDGRPWRMHLNVGPDL